MIKYILSISLIVFYSNVLAVNDERKPNLKSENKIIADGILMPRSKLSFFAPMPQIRIMGWNSRSSGVKPVYLIPEGTYVKKGTLMAEFEIDIKDMENWIIDKISWRKKDASSQLAKILNKIDEVKLKYNKKKIESERLKQELKKESILSKRDYQLLKMDFNIAKYEEEALEKQVSIHENHYDNSKSYFDKEHTLWKGFSKTVEDFNKKFKVFAPLDGYVAYPVMPHRRTKPRIGEWVRTGWEYMNLATSREIDLEFYIPEKYYSYVHTGIKVVAEIVSNKRKFDAVITVINEFPQTIGEIEKDFDTPYARESVFSIKATPVGNVDFLPGSEIKVYLVK